MNWIPKCAATTEKDPKNPFDHTLQFEINMGSLEFLELKPLILEEPAAVTLKELYLPSLKQLSLIGDDSIRRNVQHVQYYNANSFESLVEDEVPDLPIHSGDFML